MQNKTSSLFAVFGGLIIIGSLGAAAYFHAQLNKIKQNPQQVAQDEVAAIVNEVKQIMILPEGEQPTLATVADPSKLRDQPFFAKAKVGDKVLLYTNARKAVLYDPIAKKIVEVAPINIGAQEKAAPVTPPAPEKTPAPTTTTTK